MTEIVERLHAVDVDLYALSAEKIAEFGIASTMLMTRDVERNDSGASEFLERLVNRRAVLAEGFVFQ